LEVLEDRTLLSLFWVTNTDDSGPGSFRQAILDANADSGPDVIAFNIGNGGTQSVAPTSPLPSITNPVFIDATTQPGYAGAPLIELTGHQAGRGADGIVISAGNSTVRGLVINGFQDGSGIVLQTNGSDLIAGNYIGTDVNGTTAVPNKYGVKVTSENNSIGGTSTGARNVISGNGTYGIWIENAAENVVAGNLIGTDSSGLQSLGYYLSVGIEIEMSGSTNNLIGGTVPTARNVIAGDGIDIQAPANRVQGNYIGTDISGTRSLGGDYGLQITADDNLIGGIEAGAGNVISGFSRGFAIGIGTSSGNRVQGNLIGTDRTGASSLGNHTAVDLAVGAHGNIIGGSVPGAGNLISGNDFSGIWLYWDASDNLIQGNLIGTDITGTKALGNADDVILDQDTRNNLIGGLQPGAGNLISGGVVGVIVYGQGNTLQANYIGTDITGSTALGNQVGVGVAGSNIIIGGAAPGAGNLISGNRSDGISISSANSFGVIIQGNRIGTDASGTHGLGNGANGVRLFDGATNNTIGGTTAGASNIIAYNAHDGVLVNNAAGNAMRRNVIFAHDAGLGIELTNNGNNSQAYPVLTSAISDSSSTTITGTLTSAPSTTFTIEFFVNTVCNPSGYGEGERFLGSTTVTTDSDGHADFTFTVAIPVDPGQFISATATDPAGNTSQFSACVVVTGADTPAWTIAGLVPLIEPADTFAENRLPSLGQVIETSSAVVLPTLDTFLDMFLDPEEESVHRLSMLTTASGSGTTLSHNSIADWTLESIKVASTKDALL
jgi:titin